MRIILCGAILAAAPALSPAAAEKVDHKVIVNGSTYRVTVEDNSVTVAKKAFLVRSTLDERDALREAVFKATGCRIVDEMQNAAKLTGRLKCEPSGG